MEKVVGSGSESVCLGVGSNGVGVAKGENKVNVRFVWVDNSMELGEIQKVNRVSKEMSAEEKVVYKLSRLYSMDIELGCYVRSKRLYECWESERDELLCGVFEEFGIEDCPELRELGVALCMGDAVFEWDA